MRIRPKKSQSRTPPSRDETAPSAGGSGGATRTEAEPATALVDGLHEVGAEPSSGAGPTLRRFDYHWLARRR
jgi:hypothetical protein